jgi:hypothetical protein
MLFKGLGNDKTRLSRASENDLKASENNKAHPFRYY